MSRLIGSISFSCLILITLTSCKLLESKENLGGLLGAAAGYQLGDKAGKNKSNRKYYRIAGAYLGYLAGSGIGKKLDEEDRKRMVQTTQQAVVSGKSTSWSNSKNKTSGTSKVVNTIAKAEPIKVKVLKSKVKKVPPLEIIGSTYVASKRTNVRGGPSTDYVVVGKLENEQTVRVVGEVKGQPWYMISEGGAGSGFVYKPLLSAAPTVEVEEEAVVDASDIAEEVVAQKTLCREIENSVTLADGTTQNEKLTACQGPNGWEIKQTPA